MEEEDEDKILLRREYKKHIQNIKKSRTREKHFKYKNIGYTEALENYEDDIKYFSILFGYLERKQDNETNLNET
ncbi:hypothetical protein NBO_317g0001 [Nosema bombycis CQ1]|uniref:Uncharacterized protein n=1 Tax=Nosema bombycis (strain CQ1 / CVCC 102059) TaxID=578461 RepID=R0KRT6_NOSB1|nr:hypothetical protein NBO_317g0001 [Nosema bombycis CQ1]|eukprot:EOB12912.1 hypothetical protein NBO_317g0001 [Nosema bombycis CQ1]